MKFGKTMSRIGKKPILIPEKVTVKVEGEKVIVTGPKGELTREVRPEIRVEVKEGKVKIRDLSTGKEKKSKVEDI